VEHARPAGAPRGRDRRLVKTQDRVARREIGIAEGDTLTVEGLRAARRRLEETGVFERITLRPRPRGTARPTSTWPSPSATASRTGRWTSW